MIYILYPAIDKLLEKVENRFTLVVLVSKRARQLTVGAKSFSECLSTKQVTIATEEVSENLLTVVI